MGSLKKNREAPGPRRRGAGSFRNSPASVLNSNTNWLFCLCIPTGNTNTVNLCFLGREKEKWWMDAQGGVPLPWGPDRSHGSFQHDETQMAVERLLFVWVKSHFSIASQAWSMQNLNSKEEHTTKVNSIASTLCMHTAILPKQWQPWTAAVMQILINLGFWEMTTYPSPKSTLTLTSHLGQNGKCWLEGRVGGAISQKT